MHKFIKIIVMKVRHSIKSSKSRDKNCKVVRRRGKIYVINKTTNRRLLEMGLIRGTIVRVVKIVAGMIQLKLDNSDIVIREELLNEIEYEKK